MLQLFFSIAGGCAVSPCDGGGWRRRGTAAGRRGAAGGTAAACGSEGESANANKVAAASEEDDGHSCPVKNAKFRIRKRMNIPRQYHCSGCNQWAGVSFRTRTLAPNKRLDKNAYSFVLHVIFCV